MTLVTVRLIQWSFETGLILLVRDKVQQPKDRCRIAYWTDIRIEFNGHTNFKFKSIYRITDLKFNEITVLLTCNLYIHFKFIDINNTFQKHFSSHEISLLLIFFTFLFYSRQMMDNGRIYVFSSGTLFPLLYVTVISLERDQQVLWHFFKFEKSLQEETVMCSIYYSYNFVIYYRFIS